ncbi:exo-alpha-sialidase [Haladaptatus sp. F3-133]|uniref:Exo-alpha-sialidase n=1 Tax=Halorutilus salinus TaxID=2487751 RepID=A0A9Q4C841_9EURY|nr:exo-alpha-sialidase [Halorutilus salinus]MCX2820006.1 exo-alpha-sialidase [Halorutilus salinus]
MRNSSVIDYRIATVALLVVAAVTVPAVASAQGASDGTPQVVGSPDIELSTPDNRIQTGTSQTVTVQVANSGDITRAGPSDLEARVTTARNAVFEADQGSLPDGMELNSGSIVASSVPTGGIDPVEFTFDVSDSLEAGSYRVPIAVSYDYTRLAERTGGGGTRYSDFSTEKTKYITLIVEDDARFSVEAVESNVIAGDSGSYVLRVRNTGVETARNPRVTLTADETGVFFGDLGTGQPAKTVSVSDSLSPGEATDVSVTAGADSDVTPASYPVDATVKYESTGGVTHESPVATTTMSVGDEQSFSFFNITSSLRVGEEGSIHGEIENTGPQPADSVVVRYADSSQTVTPIEETTAVGSVDVGESSSFSLPISVSTEAKDGQKSVGFSVRYRDSDKELQSYDKLDVQAEVAPERDRFGVEIVNRTISAGGSRTVDISLTNNLNETADDVEARLFADDPLDTGDTDTGYVQSLEPGETADLTFDLTSTASATPDSTYPISVDVRYDDTDGDSHLSDTYRLPIDVTEAEAGGLPLPVIVVALMLFGTGGLVVYRRRK